MKTVVEATQEISHVTKMPQTMKYVGVMYCI
jgi:hypothetical protein